MSKNNNRTLLLACEINHTQVGVEGRTDGAKICVLHGTPWSRLSQKRQDLDYETQWKRFNAYGW
jgi:hypothetical protein